MAAWAFEIKFDGVRSVAYVSGGGLRLYSRNDRDVSATYPEFGALGIDEGTALDGELVALDERGRPDFGRLQIRMHVGAPTAALLAEIPVQYMVFDLLRHNGRPTIGLPYVERRALLDGLNLDDTARARVPPNFMAEYEDARVRATCGVKYARLAAIKARYDPANLLHRNANVAPA